MKMLELTDIELEGLKELIIFGQETGGKKYKAILPKLPDSLIKSIKSEYGDKSAGKNINFSFQFGESIDLMLKKMLIRQSCYYFSGQHPPQSNPLLKLKLSEQEYAEVFDRIYAPKSEFNSTCRAMAASAMFSNKIKLTEKQITSLLKAVPKTISDMQIVQKFIMDDFPNRRCDVNLMTAVMKREPTWAVVFADRSVLPYLVNVKYRKSYHYKAEYLQIRMSVHPENFSDFYGGLNFLKNHHSSTTK